MTKTKILVVDDDEGMRNQLRWGFDDYDVITADSRLHAIEQFNIHNPPLVTLDLGMPPDVDGITEGLAALKEILEKAPKTKVVVISGSELSDSADMAINGGACEYCAKPIELDHLQQLIRKAYIDYQAK